MRPAIIVLYIFIRKYAQVFGARPVQELVEPEMFHQLMAQAVVDPLMYVLNDALNYKSHCYNFAVNRFVYKDNASMVAMQLHR